MAGGTPPGKAPGKPPGAARGGAAGAAGFFANDGVNSAAFALREKGFAEALSVDLGFSSALGFSAAGAGTFFTPPGAGAGRGAGGDPERLRSWSASARTPSGTLDEPQAGLLGSAAPPFPPACAPPAAAPVPTTAP